jgi:hypothetical protein
MLVKKGVMVECDFGAGKVVAVTKEWVVVDCGGRTGEVALHRVDDPVWCLPTDHEEGGGDEEFEAKDW